MAEDDGPTADPTDEPTEEVPRPTGEVFLAKAPRSALVGLMAAPLSRSVPVRRSTVLMLIGFLGFGTLMALYPPTSKPAIGTANGQTVIPLVPATTTTTTRPPATTTTTRPPTTTTSTTGSPTTTVPGATSTTTAAVP